jgi:hypothetical protein
MSENESENANKKEAYLEEARILRPQNRQSFETQSSR